MIDTKTLRAKYARRSNSRGILFFPTGGVDVIRLCNAVDDLLLLVRDLQATADPDLQTKIEQQLWKI